MAQALEGYGNRRSSGSGFKKSLSNRRFRSHRP